MGASGIQLLAVLLVCVSSTEATGGSYTLEMWNKKDQPLQDFSSVYKDIEALKYDQALLREKQESMFQALMQCTQKQANPYMDVNITSLQGSSSTLDSIIPEDEDVDDEDITGGSYDPCYHYTVLNQAWRATTYTTKNVTCDRNVQWYGWYRLFYNGRSIQMPELCVKREFCGTHAPLWLVGGHPRRRDGIVRRNVCGHWENNCCAFKSPPIQVKACKGNFYVYKFVKPLSCHLAYCADVNTLACGKCKKTEICRSKNKINWFCKKKKRILKPKVHFFASYSGKLTGKVNRIQYNKVHVNVGMAFKRQTGVFTAPTSGVYQFFFSTQSESNGTKTDLWLVVNGYWVAMSHTLVGKSNTVGNLSTYMTKLRKGAVVYVTQDCGNSWATAASNTIVFGGSLLLRER